MLYEYPGETCFDEHPTSCLSRHFNQIENAAGELLERT
jgi:hypothetical protein